MRLLHTSTLKLCEFHDDEIPDYAILSHTWEDGEVSFQEMESVGSGRPALPVSDGVDQPVRLETRGLKGPPGYIKVTRCCALAVCEGWNYVWIDTCCIDKTSSAELSEAINSMYRWYENAQVCYVYMADISGHSMERFQWSRWFTRGWTLQEMLAPSTVVFYDKDWIEIGTRWSLRPEISQATGMTYESIISPKESSIATKMSWASNRKTTRVEDIAYCLMGLFDINMPLLYGEGQKAFMRLQYEIMQSRDDDESIFAWRDAGLSSSGMFARSPEAFADSGEIHCVRNPDPNLGPPAVTRNLLLFEASIPRTNVIQEGCLVLLNCALARSSKKYLAVEVRLGSSGYYLRSSPGNLTEADSLRSKQTQETKNYINDTLKMLLNYTEYRSTKQIAIKQQQTLLIREPLGYILKEAYTPYARFVPNTPLHAQKNDMTGPKLELYEDERLEWPKGFVSRSDGIFDYRIDSRTLRIKLQDDRPVAAILFVELRAVGRDNFAVILTASGAAPSIEVVVPSTETSLSKVLEPHLEELSKNYHHLLSRREPGPDQLTLLLQSGRRFSVTIRNRVVEGDKVYFVHMIFEES